MRVSGGTWVGGGGRGGVRISGGMLQMDGLRSNTRKALPSHALMHRAPPLMICSMSPPSCIQPSPDDLQHAPDVRLIQRVRWPRILDARVLLVQVGRAVVVLQHEQEGLTDLGGGEGERGRGGEGAAY